MVRIAAAAVEAGAGGKARIRNHEQPVFGGPRSQSVLEDQMRVKLHGFALHPHFLLLAVAISLTGCSKTEKPSIKVFNTPEDAGNALLAVAKADDTTAALAIFGPESKELIFSGDAVEDKNGVDAFVARYGVMHRWRKLTGGAQMLLVGADNFPFPIPLKKNVDGKWFFDTAAGKEEILNRRIGRNELAIIDVCEAVARAQSEYFSKLHDGATRKQYALKFISDPGKQNGLYWQSSPGQPESPLGPLVAFATAEGYSAKPDAHVPFHGYYFHMLKGQSEKARGGAKNYVVDGKMTNGFGFVAYPAEYGNSGVMTFMVNQDGVLLQKDLGKTTTVTASAMSEFDPDNGWILVEE